MNEELSVDAPRRGRPPAVKKGNSTWQPANVLDVFDKEPGYRYRIVEKTPRNIAKKQRENWEMVSAIQSPGTGNNTGNSLDKGRPLTSVLEGYDYVIMRMPEEEALKRDAYFNNESSRRMSALRKNTAQDFGQVGRDGAPIHGEITIEKKGIRNIIKE